jgi:hypothetical protein
MNDYQFIKEFTNITVASICKKLDIRSCNIFNGQTTEENYRKVKNEIIRELLMLMIQSKSEDMITLALYDEVIMKLERENKMLKEMI